MTENKKNNEPVAEVRIGTIKAAIWQNPRKEVENGVRYNTTFQRLYRGEKGWQSTDSFGYHDLLVLAKVASEAHTRVHELLQEQRMESQQ